MENIKKEESFLFYKFQKSYGSDGRVYISEQKLHWTLNEESLTLKVLSSGYSDHTHGWGSPRVAPCKTELSRFDSFYVCIDYPTDETLVSSKGFPKELEQALRARCPVYKYIGYLIGKGYGLEPLPMDGTEIVGLPLKTGEVHIFNLPTGLGGPDA